MLRFDKALYLSPFFKFILSDRLKIIAAEDLIFYHAQNLRI